MQVDDVLSTHIVGLAPLNRPIMIVALSGWFDASGAATGAASETRADAGGRTLVAARFRVRSCCTSARRARTWISGSVARGVS